MARASSSREPSADPDSSPSARRAGSDPPSVLVVPDPSDDSPRGRFLRGEIGWGEFQLSRTSGSS